MELIRNTWDQVLQWWSSQGPQTRFWLIAATVLIVLVVLYLFRRHQRRKNAAFIHATVQEAVALATEEVAGQNTRLVGRVKSLEDILAKNVDGTAQVLLNEFVTDPNSRFRQTVDARFAELAKGVLVSYGGMSEETRRLFDQAILAQASAASFGREEFDQAVFALACEQLAGGGPPEKLADAIDDLVSRTGMALIADLPQPLKQQLGSQLDSVLIAAFAYSVGTESFVTAARDGFRQLIEARLKIHLNSPPEALIKSIDGQIVEVVNQQLTVLTSNDAAVREGVRAALPALVDEELRTNHADRIAASVSQVLDRQLGDVRPPG